jgi:hypothetical protein
MRVIDEQAAVFAGYKCEGSGTVWYNVDPKMAEKLCSCGERMDEFAWLRDLALDHADLTAALAACEDDYAAIVRTLREVQIRHLDEYRTELVEYRAELVKNALSSPRAVAVLRVGR